MVKQNGPDPMDLLVGAAVRARRRELQVSQSTLGEACGVTFQQIQKYENGKNRISASMLTKISGCLKVAPAFFLPNKGGITFNGSSEIHQAMANKEAQDIVTTFMHIKSLRVRHAMLELLRAIAAAKSLS